MGLVRLVAVSLCVLCTSAMAEITPPKTTLDPEEFPTAVSLIEEAAAKTDDYQDMDSELEMTTIEKNGKQLSRTIRIRMLRLADGQEEAVKSLVVFLKPARERGVALLSHLYDDVKKDDKQWLYLPNLRKTKPILGSERSGSFMGSEFSYSDLSPQGTSQHSYRQVYDATVDGRPHWKLEASPLREQEYSKLILWMDKETLIVTRKEYYNQAGELWKVLLSSDIREDAEGNKRAHKLEMSNVLNQRKTILQERTYKLNTGLKESIFDEIELPFAL